MVRSPTVTSLRPASSSSAARGITRPARRTSAARMSSSSAVTSIGWPSTLALRAAVSTTMPAAARRSPATSGSARRSTARMRASSSRGLNGLAT